MNDPILGLLGLSARAGNLVFGAACAEEAIKHGRGSLLVIARDAGENTKRQMRVLSQRSQIPTITYGDKFSLGKSTGKTEKAVLLLTDANMANAILKRMDACEKQAETEVHHGEIE